MPFDVFMEMALYGDEGFFATGRGAGRAGSDFVTSVETGSLFGALVAEAIDREWDALGNPDPFVVIEAGAGSGKLARDIARAHPRCAAALRYLLVEKSAVLRDHQRSLVALDDPSVVLGPFGRAHGDESEDPLVPIGGGGPLFAQLGDLPAGRFDGVILCNELLDNLPFGIAEFDGARWHEARVGVDEGGAVELLFTAMDDDAVACAGAVVGTRIPLDRSLTAWFESASRCLRTGAVLVIDYVVAMDEIVARSPNWLRTYHQHRRGHDPLVVPGRADITADVPLEYVEHAAQRCGFLLAEPVTQAEWLRELGIEDRVRSAQALWAERAHVGDLEAMKAKSIVHEASVLTEEAGLGSFAVLRLQR